jgi:hypothetical protein
MATAPADIVRQLLIDSELGTAPRLYKDWPVYVANEPDQPDKVITIYDTAGFNFGRLHPTGATVQHFGILIRVRGTGYVATRNKIKDIETFLNESVFRTTITVGSTSFLVQALTQRTQIISLGSDQENSNRYLFTVNYTLVFTQL